MAEIFKGYVRRIDFEPKQDYLESHIYAHVFLKSLDGEGKVDVYTDNPRFEAAFLTAFSLVQVTRPPKRVGYIEVHYEEVGQEKKVVRVALDEELV